MPISCRSTTGQRNAGQADSRKPLLCKGFQGGRYWDRTSDLCRVKVFQRVSLTWANVQKLPLTWAFATY